MSLYGLTSARINAMRFVKCKECERLFDLASASDAEEWYYGHDCS